MVTHTHHDLKPVIELRVALKQHALGGFFNYGVCFFPQESLTRLNKMFPFSPRKFLYTQQSFINFLWLNQLLITVLHCV